MKLKIKYKNVFAVVAKNNIEMVNFPVLRPAFI